MLTKRRRLNPSKEWFFASENKEPFFIKNLETVQGDERDVIIFSIGYAKDTNGKLYLNFGPLNRDGGERRLNVAITRAKHNVKIVTSLNHNDIDLSRTESKGVQLLKDYLEYAELGAEATIHKNQDLTLDNLGYELEIYDYLKQLGLEVEMQLGCSSSKITLAVKMPNNPNYFMAIECDGKSYCEYKNTRDRDRLRQAILEKMGWKYYRIWAIDWFRDKEKEKQSLLKAITSALNGDVVKDDGYNPAPTESEQKEHFAFPLYECVGIAEVASRLQYRVPLIISEIISKEAPISEEWLIKRLSPVLGGGDRVTNTIKRKFEEYFNECDRLEYLRKNGFIYSSAPIPMLRVPNGSGIKREIKHIDLQELANGLRQIIKISGFIDEKGLFTSLANQLGYTHIGESIKQRFMQALALIPELKISADGKYSV